MNLSGLFFFLLMIILMEFLIFMTIYPWLSIELILIWCLATGVLGFHLLYQQYFQLENLRTELKTAFRQGQRPNELLLQKIILPFIGGWLLLIPGIVTDLLGLICFLPMLPRGLNYILNKSPTTPSKRGPMIIDGEFKREPKDKP